jgi:hypothetical protein
MPSDSTALEQLLHVVTAQGTLSWKEWKDACWSLSALLDFNGLSPGGAARALDELGHVEIAAENGSVKVMAAPAVLVRLPKAGVAVGVLSGGRSPQASQRLAAAAAAHGAQFFPRPHLVTRPETPSVLCVEAEDAVILASIAVTAEIRFANTPPAWALAHAAGTIAAYIASLSWRHGPEPSLEGREFNPANGRFGPIQRGAQGMRLIQYYPRANAPFWELRDGSRAARTDRDWGIHACLSCDGREHLVYDRELNALAVPLEKPLPRPLGRALVLCSGEAPDLITSAAAGWTTAASDCYYVYRHVPRNIADLVLNKLGQDALPLHIPLKNTGKS